jgi:hypothetical protein
MTSATDLATVAPRDIAAADPEQAAGALAHVLGTGDLSRLTNDERVAFYLEKCRRAGIDSLSRPFQWIEFKETNESPPVLTLYLKPSGAAQILRTHRVSFHFVKKEVVGELFKVEVEGREADGRVGYATKYVPLTGKYGKLGGWHLANAFMAAESGALRRLCVLMFGEGGGPDAEDVASWRPVTVDGRGNVLEHPSEEQAYLAETPSAARAIGEPTFESTAASSDAAPFEAAPRQRPAPAEPERPVRPPAERPSFRPSKADVERWLGAWFAAVDGTSLDDDDARHRFVEQWTASYGPDLRTDSLRTFFEHCTARQAGDLLAHVRAIVADEKRAIAEG